MGKRAIAALLVLVGVAALSRNDVAQDVTGETSGTSFKAGTFFTADDYAHLDAALGCINLKPGDLTYEKKHRPDDKLRLKVCDAALDDPLGLPLVAEQCADAFGLRGSPATRGKKACDLLDPFSPDRRESRIDRWTAEEDTKDRATRKALQDKADALEKGGDAKKARATLDAAFEEALFGGAAKQVQEMEPEEAAVWQGEMYALGQETFVPLAALQRTQATEASRLLVGQFAPAHFAETTAIIPGCEAETSPEDWIPLADVNSTYGCIRAATLLLDSVRSKWVEGYSSIVMGGGEGAVADGEPSSVAGVTGGVLAAWQGPLGKVVIGGQGPNTYEGDDYIIIIDLGGDDVYRGRIACGLGVPGKSPLSVVVDLKGNDRYEGDNFTQGFGFYGVGILYDIGAGNDHYKCGFCGQGCGLCGYGELYDDGGDDVYLSDSAAQGAGCFGYGHLVDERGHDTYRGARYVQGFAQVMGVGVLTDGAGNDLYYAGGKYLHQPLWNDRYQSLSQGFSIGNRNDRGIGTGGGVALLLDEGDGNDVYHSDIYGQGSSYWYSLGMLVDRAGNDTYTSGQYCQGVGIHLSAGIMVDVSGNDTYTMGVGLGQGAAHDWAVGWQIDRAGNDFYQGNGQGMGLNFSTGILLDCAGDDSHCTNNEGSIGKGSNNDISLLLDLAGADSYGPKEIEDGQFTKRGDHQLVYDVPQGWFIGIDTSTWPTKQDPAPTRLVVQHILISWKDAHRAVAPKDPERTKAAAETLRDDVLKQARTKGADWRKLQETHNEDTADPHKEYPWPTNLGYVKPFEDLARRLGVGQIDWCESEFGYHIIKRIR